MTKIEGCYFNVMGLPLSRVWQTLKALDETPWQNNSNADKFPQ